MEWPGEFGGVASRECYHWLVPSASHCTAVAG